MANFTTLTKTQIDSLCAELGVEFVEFSRVDGGGVNSNYKLVTRARRPAASITSWFLRIHEQGNAQGRAFETLVLNALSSRSPANPHLRVSRPALQSTVKTQSGVKPVTLYAWAEGQTLESHRPFEAKALHSLGRAIASFHLALSAEHFEPRRNDPFSFDSLQERFVEIPADDALGDLALGSHRATLLRALGSNRFESKLPRGVIHGDIFPDNVLLSACAPPVIVDWEFCCTGVFLDDLAIALCSHGGRHYSGSTRFEVNVLRALLAGYIEVRPLSKAEMHAFELALRRACVRFAATRVLTYHLSQVERRKTGSPVKDFREMLSLLDSVSEAVEGISAVLLPR